MRNYETVVMFNVHIVSNPVPKTSKHINNSPCSEWRALICRACTQPVKASGKVEGEMEPATQANGEQACCSLEQETAVLEALNRELTHMLVKMNTLSGKHFILMPLLSNRLNGPLLSSHSSRAAFKY